MAELGPLVVDASAALGWVLKTQGGPRSDEFLAELRRYRLIAPDVFAWETSNVLRLWAVRGSLNLDDTLQQLHDLRITVLPPRVTGHIYELTEFARSVGLSLFDAAYLALAIESGGELVSRDKALLTVARANAIPCHDLSEPSVS
ncbi:type II toxin-antitoxin system VapC family toxin [Maricaulis sp.]|uniref:type II toxin-antitoxin system VapC family toxin n=1 Tax=Maricaulis sp. TaxID=1486257 RepID=UPI003A94A51F